MTNRKIAFRAWDKQNGMSYDLEALAARIGTTAYAIAMGEFNGFIPMQYTGLTDKNGKEIYEGDVVKFGRPYSNERAVIRSYVEDTYWLIEQGRRVFKTKPTYEVIGNIYENPELLTK